MKIKKVDEYKNESFDFMIGIENFLNNPTMLIMATAWVLRGDFNPDTLKTTTKTIRNDFLDYCSSFGYVIDKDVLDLKFDELVKKVKNTLKA